MHDARVAVADRSVHGHEPRHRHRAAIDGETLLLPVELGEQAPEVCLAGGGIEDVRDEHEAVGQPHAQIMYAASGVDKELHEVERVPCPREAPGWRAPPSMVSVPLRHRGARGTSSGMRQLTCTGPGTIEWRDVPEPRLQSDVE